MTKKKRAKKRPADKWDCPSWLGDDGRGEWSRIVERLRDVGSLSDVEPPAVESYCRAYETWRRAEAWISDNGLVSVSRNDKGEVKGVAAVPHVGISAKAFAQMRQFLTDCGLTPRSGVGGSGSEPETVEEKRARFIRGIVG